MLVHRVIMIILLSNGFIFGMEQKVREDLAAYTENIHAIFHAVEHDSSSALLYRDYGSLSRPIYNYHDTQGRFWHKVTPLILATFYNKTSMVEFLIGKKVIVNLAGEDGDTALHVAARTGRDVLVEKLLKAGADVFKPNITGDTALQVADKSLLRQYASSYKSMFENIIGMLRQAQEVKKILNPEIERHYLQQMLSLQANI